MWNVIVQLLGGVALLFWVLSIQTKDKRKILKLQNVANIFYAIQYFFLNAISACVMNSMSVIRGLFFLNNEKKGKSNSKKEIVIFSIITVVIGIVTYNTWYSLIPIINTLGYGYSTWQKNTRLIRIIFIIAAIGWVIYNSIVGAYIPLIGNAVELIAGIYAMIRLDRNTKEITKNE